MVRIKNILCPVDFFPASERAADYAIELARTHKAKLTLMHAIPPLLSTAYDLRLNDDVMVEAMADAANGRLRKLASRAKSKGILVQTVVRFGYVDMEIRAIAAARKADFIVMGTHGRHGFEQWFMGSVTERMLRHATVPLLTMKAPNPGTRPAPIRRILVTTDFSDGTLKAINVACSLAQESKARVTLLHVLNDVDGEIGGRYREPLIRSIWNELEHLLPKELRSHDNVATMVTTGVPYKRILEIQKAGKIDLIVMNVHGKGFLDRAIIGSTAERVVRGAGCPVLMIPAPASTSKATGKGGLS